jgi:hypothetical protein
MPRQNLQHRELPRHNVLGRYASAIRDAGGFAEFHGSAGSRHLHVVPTANAIGDTSVPARVSAGYAGAGTTQNVSFNITAGPNATPEQIAQAVMVKLARVERSTRERM